MITANLESELLEDPTFFQLRESGLNIQYVDYSIDKTQLEPVNSYDAIVVHHTGDSSDYSINRLVQAHVVEEHWGAIGYHFVINKNGEIFYTRPLKFKGAHAFPNTGKIGIAFSFSLNQNQVTDEALSAYQILLLRLKQLYNIDSDKVVGHVEVQIDNLNNALREVGEREVSLAKFLETKTLDEFKRLKQVEKERLRDFPEILSLVDTLKTCPGVNFFSYLRSGNK